MKSSGKDLKKMRQCCENVKQCSLGCHKALRKSCYWLTKQQMNDPKNAPILKRGPAREGGGGGFQCRLSEF